MVGVFVIKCSQLQIFQTAVAKFIPKYHSSKSSIHIGIPHLPCLFYCVNLKHFQLPVRVTACGLLQIALYKHLMLQYYQIWYFWQFIFNQCLVFQIPLPRIPIQQWSIVFAFFASKAKNVLSYPTNYFVLKFKFVEKKILKFSLNLAAIYF